MEPERQAAMSATTAPAGSSSTSGILIGRFFGVPVYVTPTWFVVAALITWIFGANVEREMPGIGIWRYAVSLSYALLLYGSVLIHELSHTAVALRAGLPVRRISLYLLGGVSEIEAPATRPAVDARIAAAGPIVSLLLGVLSLAALNLLEPGTVVFLLVRALMWSNLLVGVFNLLPGLPLDGGRILAAAIWKVTGRQHTGLIVAAWAGRGLALIVLFLPGATAVLLGWQPDVIDLVWGALLASFIWISASQSLYAAKIQRRLPTVTAAGMTRPAVAVPGELPLAEALRRAQDQQAGAVVVVDTDGDAVAIMNEAAVAATPLERRPWVSVADVSRRIRPEMVLPMSLSGHDLLAALARAQTNEYLVVDQDHDGRIVGVLLAADVEHTIAGP